MQDRLRSAVRSMLPDDGGRIWIYCGTFLIAYALLSFEVSTVRTINFTVGPSFIYFAIAIAMLGLGAAGTILSLVRLQRLKPLRAPIMFWGSIAIAVLLVITHVFVADSKEALNDVLRETGVESGLIGVAGGLLLNGLVSALRIGLVLSLPYFIFGALLAFLFATSERALFGRLYAADLIGAAVGCVGAIAVMEWADYAASVTAPAVFAALAGAAFVAPSEKRLAAVGVLVAAVLAVLPISDRYAEAIEPPSDPNYLVRDYRHELQVDEVWRDWNSYTRVGSIDLFENGVPNHAIMSLSNGDGMAWLHPFHADGAAPVDHWPARWAMLLDPPRDALIMLAGAGADMLALHRNAPGHTRVTGIELNSTLVAGALGRGEYELADLLAEPNVDLQIAEGRVFLERDPRRYDVILYSWSGATAAHYAGSLGGTIQFLFTYEGLSAALDHLKPGGYTVLLQVNKVKALAALRRYLDARGIGDAAETAVILFDPEARGNGWDRMFDDNPLLIKPDGWRPEEVARLRQSAAAYGFQIAYAPGVPTHPDYGVYRRILNAPDVESELAALRAETDLRFEVVTDDRPFHLDLFVTGLYLEPGFWFRLADGDFRVHEAAMVIRLAYSVIISACAVLFIIFPLFLRRGPKASTRSASHLTYFFCLGSGFMILEIVLMQKFSLLFGNPALTIAIVLAGVILFAGFGSLISGWTFTRGLSFRRATIGIVAYVLVLYLGLDPVLHAMLSWPLAAKGLGLVAIIAPGAVLLGQMFPQGLALAGGEDTALIPWAWGINGAMSTVAAGLTPLMAQAWGFNVVFLIAGGLYAVILLLPAYAGSGRPVPVQGHDALAAAE